MLRADARRSDRLTYRAQNIPCAAMGVVHIRADRQLHPARGLTTRNQGFVLQSGLPACHVSAECAAVAAGKRMERRPQRSESSAADAGGTGKICARGNELQRDGDSTVEVSESKHGLAILSPGFHAMAARPV